MAGKNPTWTREELTIVLDLYRLIGHGHPGRPDVIALAKYLQEQQFAVPGNPAKFRNANGVGDEVGGLRVPRPARMKIPAVQGTLRPWLLVLTERRPLSCPPVAMLR